MKNIKNITAFEWINSLIKSEDLYENSLFEAHGVSPLASYLLPYYKEAFKKLKDENREIEAKDIDNINFTFIEELNKINFFDNCVEIPSNVIIEGFNKFYKNKLDSVITLGNFNERIFRKNPNLDDDNHSKNICKQISLSINDLLNYSQKGIIKFFCFLFKNSDGTDEENTRGFNVNIPMYLNSKNEQKNLRILNFLAIDLDCINDTDGEVDAIIIHEIQHMLDDMFRKDFFDPSYELPSNDDFNDDIYGFDVEENKARCTEFFQALKKEKDIEKIKNYLKTLFIIKNSKFENINKENISHLNRLRLDYSKDTSYSGKKIMSNLCYDFITLFIIVNKENELEYTIKNYDDIMKQYKGTGIYSKYHRQPDKYVKDKLEDFKDNYPFIQGLMEIYGNKKLSLTRNFELTAKRLWKIEQKYVDNLAKICYDRIYELKNENKDQVKESLVFESGTEDIEKSVLKKRLKNNEEAKIRRQNLNTRAKQNQNSKEWRQDHPEYEKQRRIDFPEYEKARAKVDYLRNLQKKGTKRRDPVTDEEIQKAIEERTRLRPKTASNFRVIDDSEKIWYDEINKVMSKADSVTKIMNGLAKIAKNLNAALKEEENSFYREKFDLLVNLLNKAKNNNAVKFDTYDEKVCLDMAAIDKLGDSSKYVIPKEFSKYKRFSKIISINQIGKGEKISQERNERNKLKDKTINELREKEKSYLDAASKEDEQIANSVMSIDDIIKIVNQKIAKYKKIQDELLPRFKEQGLVTNDMVFKKKLRNFVKLKEDINNNIELLKKYDQIRFDLYSIDRDTNAKKRALRNLNPSSEEYKKIAADDRKGVKKIGKRNSTVPALSMLLRKDYYDKRAREQKLKRIQANKEELKQYIKKMNSEKLSPDEKEDLKNKIKKLESHINQMESKLNTNESCMNTKEIINFINEAISNLGLNKQAKKKGADEIEEK